MIDLTGIEQIVDDYVNKEKFKQKIINIIVIDVSRYPFERPINITKRANEIREEIKMLAYFNHINEDDLIKIIKEAQKEALNIITKDFE